MKKFASKLVGHAYFERFIIALILINAVLLGLETVPEWVVAYGAYFDWGNRIIVAVFVIEAALKITAVAPRLKLYFGNGWNLFDFSIVVFSLIPFSGEYAMLARLARLLRVLRLISVLPELRLIVATLVRSIPSMANIMLLMSIIFYIYAVAGYHLFSLHDPQHWGTLGLAMLSLFRIVTLEDWTDLMYTAMELHGFAWIYFVSFVIVGTFVVINLFIAVVINNLEESKVEKLKEMEELPSKDELITEIRDAQRALASLQARLEKKI
jgi:voltage-gated sodium channel